jgi:hypothetical protein
MRITLTAKQLETEGGKALLDYLWWIADDGYVSDEEILHMREWLAQASYLRDITGIHYLRELVETVLEDNIIDEGERAEIHRAILRVLPKNYRDVGKQQKDNTDAIIRARNDLERRRTGDLATERQIDYLTSLGGQAYEGMTKKAASAAITELQHADGPTVRQRMVLRFWDCLDMYNCTVDQVSDWMDGFYMEDNRRLKAWEMWKHENGDRGGRTPDLINRVPIGEGYRYLKRMNSGATIKSVAANSSSILTKGFKIIVYSILGIIAASIGILLLAAILKVIFS